MFATRVGAFCRRSFYPGDFLGEGVGGGGLSGEGKKADLGEALRLSAVAGSPLTGEEPEGTATV